MIDGLDEVEDRPTMMMKEGVHSAPSSAKYVNGGRGVGNNSNSTSKSRSDLSSSWTSLGSSLHLPGIPEEWHFEEGRENPIQE
jgi:hypothetical protein